jgi:hypothetical protein
MATFSTHLGRWSRRACPFPGRRCLPRLEALEDRQMLSVSANTAPDGVFIRYTNNQLWEHTDGGFRMIDVNVLNVTSGVDATGAPAAFIVYTNGALYEWSAAGGFHAIDRNVVAVSASQQAADTVYILYDNSDLFEHVGTSPAAGFRMIDVNVVKVSAGEDAGMNPTAFILYNDSHLFEWSPTLGFHFIDVNARDISGLQDGLHHDIVYIAYDNGQAWYHAGTMPGASFFFPVGQGVVSLSAAADTTSAQLHELAVFMVHTDGTLTEWVENNPSSPFFIDSNVAGISAAQNASDTVFIVYDNQELFEHVGLPPNGIFHFIDVNVSP